MLKESVVDCKDAIEVLEIYGNKCIEELCSTVQWWSINALDNHAGGFYGEIDNIGTPDKSAAKGLVLNARILWFFSVAAKCSFLPSETRQTSCELAHRAFNYFVNHFHDAQHGGAYWSLDSRGVACSDKKQTYGVAFAIYGFCAYFELTGQVQAQALALSYYRLIETHCWDSEYQGYLECKSRDWQTLLDLPMSGKDLPSPKTMNNHLHILEAYTALQRVAPEAQIAPSLRRCLNLFEQYILHSESPHLKMFLSADWGIDESRYYSLGHDIEFSWLAHEALQQLGDANLTARWTPRLDAILRRCLAFGMGNRGELMEQFDVRAQQFTKHNEWWVQAEALVGFLNGYQLTAEPSYLEAYGSIWDFIEHYHLDRNAGEWFYHPKDNQGIASDQYKVGFWKGPYHHGRALIESTERIMQLLK